MKQAVLSKGIVVPKDVPLPNLEPGGILVKVAFSCISAGTEMSSVRSSGKSLIKRALEKPDQLKSGIGMLRQRGFRAFKQILRKQTGEAFGNALGYSASGIVCAVGEQANEFSIGQRVAIAGAGYANHSGYAYVPKNLAVPIPDTVSLEDAAPVAVGSIALEGIRVLKPICGETVAVMGMGLIGQLATQMLQAAGCRVIGIDINKNRLRFAAEQYGIQTICTKDYDGVTNCYLYTNGRGVDAVLFTAATSSSKPMSDCFKMLRPKGRFVLLGVSGMCINRADIYKKELEFKISCSYGPGRYDSSYEEGGQDYPIHEVRWTEKRNMGEYLRLIATEKLNVHTLIGDVQPVENSAAVYKLLNGPQAPFIILLSYADSHEADDDDAVFVSLPGTPRPSSAISYALVGAGSFARSMHLPNLSKHPDLYHLRAVMSRTGYSATSTAVQFGADYATTDYQRILNDPEVELVMIATKHDLHAPLAIAALRAGKNVFVEKPPALNEDELQELMQAIRESGKAYLVGYNRRFSRYIQEMKRLVDTRKNDLVLEYTMNAGYIPMDSWVHTPQGGGRIIGEGCHIIDTLGFLAGAKVKDVSIRHLYPKTSYYTPEDNVSVTLTYENGTIATMNYLANGSPHYPKETLRAYFDGKIVTMNDYCSLKGDRISVKHIHDVAPQKGQEAELIAFAKALRSGSLYPIPLAEIEQTSHICFRITKELQNVFPNNIEG